MTALLLNSTEHQVDDFVVLHCGREHDSCRLVPGEHGVFRDQTAHAKVVCELALSNLLFEQSAVSHTKHRHLRIGGNQNLITQDAIEELLAVSDLFLLTSEKESFGLAALEAMACEVPVISTNAGGIPEVNVHGVTGFVSEIGDVNDMAKNAIYILSSEETLTTFRTQALAQAKRFDINNILPIYEDYYEEIIEASNLK